MLFERLGMIEDGKCFLRQMFANLDHVQLEIVVIAEFIHNDRDQIEKTRMRNIFVTNDDLGERNVTIAEFSHQRGPTRFTIV